MLEVVRLSAIGYVADRAGDLASLLAPPFDVIGAAEKAELFARSPYNAVHLILPAGEQTGPHNRYEAAAGTLRDWLAQGVLAALPPAMWLYEQSFSSFGKRLLRRALLAGVRVQPFAERVVLPHERTYAAPKEDRYRLKMATRTHLSPFFALYDDADGSCEQAFQQAESPSIDVCTPDGMGHRLRRISDAASERITKALAPRQLVIADGHHRYDTMVRLSQELGTAEAAIGFGCLVRLQDEGLVVWPTHRLLADGFDATSFVEGSRNLFTVETRPLASAAQIEAILASKRSQAPALALVAKRRQGVDYLQLRHDADAKLADLPGPLRCIEATLLEVALAAQGQSSKLSYTHDADQALAFVQSGSVDAAFLLPPVRVQEVVSVAQAGLSMPQKSTFFYPKIPAGLLFHRFG